VTTTVPEVVPVTTTVPEVVPVTTTVPEVVTKGWFSWWS